MIVAIKIDLTKIDKSKIFVGKTGNKYIDLSLLENKAGTDQYGNDFVCVQDIGKEARERGEKGPILGNGKYRVRSAATPPAPREDASQPRYAQEPKPEQPEDDLAF